MSRSAGTYFLDGDLLKPGSIVERARLPDPPVILENAGRSKIHWNHKNTEYLYLLWRLEHGEWREKARCETAGGDVGWTLGPVARELLKRPVCDEEIARQVDEVLVRFNEALEDLDDDVRQRVCAGFYERLAAGAVNG